MEVVVVIMVVILVKAILAVTMAVMCPVGGPEGFCIHREATTQELCGAARRKGLRFVLWGFRAFQEPTKMSANSHTHTHRHTRSKIQKRPHKISSNNCLIGNL